MSFLPKTHELLDLLKSTFNCQTDLELANFLGVTNDTLSAIRHQKTEIGEGMRLTILQKVRAFDRLAYRTTEDFLLNKAESSLNKSLNSAFAKKIAAYPDLALTAKNLINKVREIRRNQQELWFHPDGETSIKSDSDNEDNELLNLYKAFRGFQTDADMAAVLGIKRNSLSTVRAGRSRLGPIPLLHIYRDFFNENIIELEAALKSSSDLLVLVQKKLGQQ
jgi:transcriptional regulator with XRE-family HTH domain